MDRESSDEEDDRENLIDQNERKLPRSTFEIGEIKTRVSRSFNFNKRYLFAICLPLVLFILFFSVDIKSFFSSVSSMKTDSASDRMRESELRALYLLRDQQLELLNVWNRTDSNTSSAMLLEDLRSVVVRQVRLNQEIQQALLSSHRVGNVSELGGNNIDKAFGECKKVEWVGERRTVEWNPKSNKYLFVICVSGQTSNHLICLEKHMFFAALLNRVLVLPSFKVDYQYNRILDIDHINKCFGRKVVISFEEFSEIKKNHIHIDRFICYVSSPTPCFVDDEHIKKLKALGLSIAKLESAWVEDVKEPKKRTIEDVMAKFNTNDEVLGIGDLFFADVEKEWITQPGGPLAHKCKTLIEPSRLIVLTAQRFIQTFLGRNFIALHFRRHGFLKFCNVKAQSCFFPIPQAANCITRVAERANTPVIYLSTDAAGSETDLLQSLTMLNGRIIPLVKRPTHNSAEKWDALLYRQGIEGDAQTIGSESINDKFAISFNHNVSPGMLRSNGKSNKTGLSFSCSVLQLKFPAQNANKYFKNCITDAQSRNRCRKVVLPHNIRLNVCQRTSETMQEVNKRNIYPPWTLYIIPFNSTQCWYNGTSLFQFFFM